MHERANKRNKILWHSGALSLLLALGQPAPALAQANEETGRSYAYGNLSTVDGDVWHQRADDFGAHEAERGSPFLPGDRIWTREPGQVELRFAGRVTAWMDQGTKLDYVEGDSPHRLGFWTGALIVWMGGDAEVVVETPGGTFSPQGEGEYRTDLLEDGRTVQFVVYSGIATVSTEWGSVLVGAGQRTIASEGTAPAPPEEYLGNDNFFAWTEDRQRLFVTTAETHYDELPEEVREYAHDLDGHGRWHQDVHLGWVWYPTVSTGWAPYRQGRWAHTPFGLTWVSYDPWGWAPYHYGRWSHGPLGWYWLPGSVWGPGWVSWSYGHNWVGWSPLNYYGYPVYDFYGYGYGYYHGNYDNVTGARGGRRGIPRGTILGKAVPRGSVADRGSWSFTDREAIGRPASRNRLSASSLKNLDDAQVLSRGAILDRGFRQRAVGVTAMTRSAKSTNRRLSNSRVATTRAASAAGRSAVGADRRTLRGQRVAIPSSAARARSTRSTYASERDRAILSREADGRGGSAGNAEANRSRATTPRATTQGRGAAGPAAAGRQTGRPEAARGRAGSAGNRPATSPRPRAGRTGETGARRPSAVRPASPRSGAAAAGRSGTPRSRPNSGAVRNRPSGASRSQPSSGASRSRPSGASRSQPRSGASRSRPSGASRSQPSSGASRGRPSGASRSQPSSGASRSRPSGLPPASRSQPSSGASRSRPSGASRSRPSSGASRSRPSGASRSRPSSGAVRSRPSGASRSRPSAASRSRPSASRSRPGGFSRFAGSGQSGASRGGGGGGGASGGGGSSASGGGSSAGGSGGGGTAVSRGSSSSGNRRPNNN